MEAQSWFKLVQAGPPLFCTVAPRWTCLDQSTTTISQLRVACRSFRYTPSPHPMPHHLRLPRVRHRQGQCLDLPRRCQRRAERRQSLRTLIVAPRHPNTHLLRSTRISHHLTSQHCPQRGWLEASLQRRRHSRWHSAKRKSRNCRQTRHRLRDGAQRHRDHPHHLQRSWRR